MLRRIKDQLDRGAAFGALALTSAVGALGWAWIHRSDNTLTPAHGAGYVIGITGAVMMVALLLYPLRKRLKFMRNWGRVSGWFRMHMALGIVGPILIVIHSDFTLRSTNATVAFLSMTTVAASGFIGRYLYGQVHRGLYGQRLEAGLLRAETARARHDLGQHGGGGTSWADELAAFEAEALSPTPSLVAAISRGLSINRMVRNSRGLILSRIDDELARSGLIGPARAEEARIRRAALVENLEGYYRVARRAATLGFYERLFSLWHVLHQPLFVILVLTAIVHVVAVHLY